MSLIKAAGAGEQSTGFYKHLLDQSLKFNEGDSSYLTRTIVSGGDRTKSTFSCWFKLSGLSGSNDWSQTFYNQGNNSGAYHYIIGMYNNAIYINDYDYNANPGASIILQTNRLFRDTSAWYHLVVRIDTTQATAADRARVYINGVQETSFATQTINVSQNANMYVMNHTLSANGSINLTPVLIGNYISGYNDGYMAEINYCDGQSLGPDSFGETKDGIWIPKDTSGLTFGTNGFHLTFKDDVVSEGFNTVTYTGNGGNQAISGIGFQPDFVWVKNRDKSSGTHHVLSDSVRGSTGGYLRKLASSMNAAETNYSPGYYGSLTSIDGDGFSVGAANSDWQQTNSSGDHFVAWCWEAGGAPTADNSAGAGATPTAGSVKIDGSNLGSALAGSIAATRISANTARGFSIISFAGNATAGATVAHSLNSTPEMLILKNRDSASEYWTVFHKDVGNTKSLFLNSTGAEDTSSAYWNNTSPTSSVFSLGGNPVNNGSGNDIICYAFHSVSGYSKFGSYTGSGSAGKQVTGLGFKPAWLMIKSTTVSGGNWAIWDNTRSVVDPRNDALVANGEDTEFVDNSSFSVDFLSDGFELNSNYGDVNQSSATYIYMAFADTREAAFFKDVSTNGNHFTPVNLDYRDSVPDVPTNNFATLNPLVGTLSDTYSEGNLKLATTLSNAVYSHNRATHGFSSGKWYFEFLWNATASAYGVFGIVADTVNPDTQYAGQGDSYSYRSDNGNKITGGTASSYGASFTTGDIIGIAVDMDNGTLTFYKNGSTQGQAFTGISGTYFPACSDLDNNGSRNSTFTFNAGQDSSFAGAIATANSNADGNGHGSFAYAPPSGYLALCSQNLPDVDIIDGTEYFNTLLYTANNASTRDFTGIGFAPDFLWFKNRTTSFSHGLYDVVRGVNKGLQSNGTGAENSYTLMTAFGDDGFSTATDGTAGNLLNYSTDSYVAWAWLAGTAFSNDASATGVGTIDSSGQVNTTAGFSIVSYTGTGSNGTVAHGLGSVPKMIIFKVRNTTDNWTTYHAGIASDAETDGIFLNLTNAAQDQAVFFNDTAPTSSVFSISTNSSVNGSSNTYIAYCFADVEGYSKVGSYTGNGSADGPFVYTGFRPAWVMVKVSSTTGNWFIVDTVRDPFNPTDDRLYPNLSNTESDATALDSVSNGFKVRNSWSDMNTSGQTYIYLAFAESPFKFANAR